MPGLQKMITEWAQYYVFEMLSKAFYSCDQYLDSHMECDTVKVKEVIDFSNRLPALRPVFNNVKIKGAVLINIKSHSSF